MYIENKKSFDKIKYNNLYNKIHNKQFNCSLKIEEYDEICNFLKFHNINKSQFIREAYKHLKKELEKNI